MLPLPPLRVLRRPAQPPRPVHAWNSEAFGSFESAGVERYSSTGLLRAVVVGLRDRGS